MNFNLFRNYKSLPISILGLSFCFNLCGCSTTSETFDCLAGNGVGCKSITEVNQLVDQKMGGKESGQDAQSIGLSQTSESFSTPIIATNRPVIEDSNSHLTAIPLSGNYSVQRMPDEYLRVWIAPFQDQQGNLHEGSVIHTVLKPGYWKMTNAQEASGSHQILDTDEKIQ